MGESAPWVAIGVSSLSFLVSLLALGINYLSYRASGARVRVSSHAIALREGVPWLQVRITNSGRAQIDIDSAWSSWFGSSLSTTPIPLAGGKTIYLIFRGTAPPAAHVRAPLTVSIVLGDGRTILKRIPLSESELGQISLASLLVHGATESTINATIQEADFKDGAERELSDRKLQRKRPTIQLDTDWV